MNEGVVPEHACVVPAGTTRCWICGEEPEPRAPAGPFCLRCGGTFFYVDHGLRRCHKCGKEA